MKIFLASIFIILSIPTFSQAVDSLETDYFDEFSYEYVPGDFNFDFIQDQVSCLENEIPLNYTERVHAFVNYFAFKQRAFIYKILDRKERFFPVFEATLARHGLPDELKYLSVIESALTTSAESHARAVGLWQFMPTTGRIYGLHQDNYIDERMDYVKATEAAALFLKQLYSMFGDWELAIAAYNTGPGNVRKAMRRSGKEKFWDIYPYLHSETRAYLPQFVAVMYVMNHLEQFNFNPENVQYGIEYDTIMVKGYTHLPTLAAQLNLCEEELININTGLKFPAIPKTEKPYVLRIPVQAMTLLKENRNAMLDSASKVDQKKITALASTYPGSTYGKDKVVYRVRSGDVLGKIASRYNVKVSDIKKWNNLRSDMIRIGQPLNIWLKPSAYTPASGNTAGATVKKSTQTIVENENGNKMYTVQPGDTLWNISNKFEGLSIEKIKELNGLKSDRITPGQKLKIG